MSVFFLVAAIVAATPATVAERIDGARSGDVIKLAPGNYPRITVQRRTFDPPLVIDAGAAHGTVSIIGSTGVTVRGGRFGGAMGKGVDGYAALVRQSSRIGFVDNGFSESMRALVIDRSTDVVVRNPAITAMQIDGINIAASQRVLVDGGSCSAFAPEPLGHPDCVQLWSRKELPITADVTVRNVTVGGGMQGITAFNHPKRGDPGFDRIVFANNKIIGTYPHGVALYDARDSEVTGNIVRTEPGSRYKASINVINCERCKQAGNDIGPKR